MESKFTDKILLCVDCGEEFVFTASAQEYFAERGYAEDPRRCKSCYMELKRSRRERDRVSPSRATSRRGDRSSRYAARARSTSGNGLPRLSDDYD
jgi:hypothetical protein